MSVITAANLAAAKTGTNLPGSFNATHPAAAPAPAAAPVAKASAPAATPSAGGGGGGSVVSSGPTAAQVAAAAAEAQYQDLLGSTRGSIQSSVNTAAGDYNTSILDYLSGEKQSQNTINSSAVQNELAKQQGLQGVTDMVGNGIQSGGVILDNDNAGSSSAGEALARAYGILGRQQASGVGNQYAQGQNTINAQQQNLNSANQEEVVDSQQKKADTINSIVNTATSQLAALNYQAAVSNIPDRVNIEQEIASVKANALSSLSAYDSELSNGFATPTTQSQNQASAAQLASAGTAAAQPFNFTTAEPTALQGSGQFASSLPIFIAPNKNNDTSTT